MCSQRTTLVLVAHLDEALNCGGLIQKRVRQNHVVHVLSLYGRKYNYLEATPEVWEQQLRYARQAKKVLGYHTLTHADLPEGDPQITGYVETVRQIEQTIANISPTQFVVPDSLDLNQDHRFFGRRVCNRTAASSQKNWPKCLGNCLVRPYPHRQVGVATQGCVAQGQTTSCIALSDEEPRNPWPATLSMAKRGLIESAIH